MDEYIKREALLKFLRKQAGEAQEIAEEYGGENIVYADCLEDVLEDVERFPAADVAPVRHGYWKDHGYKWQCSECGALMDLDGTPRENLLFYCPNCGARMDGGAEDAF